MFFKIAINNVKKSFKDYSIYFLTLTLGVCIFYTFNSIEAQNSILKMLTKPEDIKIFNKLINGTSIFVSFVLGGLIIYANNFLIKKRKKELGIYMTLGMAKGNISKLLLFETLLIGVLSLIVGLVLGILVSQGMSILAANLLNFELGRFKFIISFAAIMKTVIYFGLIYLLVMIFNQRAISKYNLIDLLNAAKKNEEVRVKNSFVSILIFLTSVGLLVTAYSRILEKGIDADNGNLGLTLLLGVIGTLFFFFSLSSFFIQVIERNKKIYLKGINIFVLRQINNKINTNFLSMTVICLMLFLTISLIFAAFDLKASVDRSEKVFDASASLLVDNEDPKENDIEEYLNKINFSFEPYEKHAFYSEYYLNITPKNLVAEYVSEQEHIDLKKKLPYLYDVNISALKISDYNAIINLKGREAIDLKDNEVLIVSNVDQLNHAFSNYTGNENVVQIEDKAYTIKNESPLEEVIKPYDSDEFFYLIVPDNFNEGLELVYTSFSVIFDDNNFEKSESKFANLFDDISKGLYKGISSATVMGFTWEKVKNITNGAVTLIVFLGLFLGLIFIITSAAVMALQQLSDASDSLERYKSLKKMGVTDKLINKAILNQSLIYFLAPLSLAILHSIIGITAVSDIFKIHSQSIIASILFLSIIYGGYFYATYIGIKNIVKNGDW